MAFGGLKGTLAGNANSITNPMPATGSVAVVVGDLVFAVCGQQTNLTVTACADNLGNTYSAVNAGTDPGVGTSRAFYSRVTVAGTLTTVNFTTSASTNDAAVVAAVIEGPFRAVTPLDANPANNNNTDNASPFTCPATGTLAQAQEAVLCWMSGSGTSAVWSATSPNLKAVQTNNSTNINVIIGYQAVSATTTVSPEFTGTNPTDSVQGTASFRQDTGIAVGSAAGTGAASGTGISTAEAVGSAAGTGSSSVVGSSTAASPGSASGVGASAVVGTGIVAATGSAAGTGGSTIVGASTFSGVGSAVGTGSSSIVGTGVVSATGSSSGTGAASATGEAVSGGGSDGSAAGIGTASGVGTGIVSATGSASGTGASSIVGASIFSGVGSASGTGAAVSIGTSTAEGAGAATGVGDSLGDGAVTVEIVGSAAGIGDALGVDGSFNINLVTPRRRKVILDAEVRLVTLSAENRTVVVPKIPS